MFGGFGINSYLCGMKKMIKRYAVVIIKSSSYEEIFTSTDKELCKNFKKENKGKYSYELAVIYAGHI